MVVQDFLHPQQYVDDASYGGWARCIYAGDNMSKHAVGTYQEM